MMETIVWVGFSQSIFAAILIAAKKNIQIQDKILSAWLFLLAIEFLTCAIDIHFWNTPLLSSTFLLFNPAFFLYIKSLTKPEFKLKYIHLLHLAPFLIFESMVYILKEKLNLDNFFVSDSNQWFRFTFSIASIISWIIYNFLSSKMVFYHRKKLENEFSNIESNRNLKWILFLVVFYNLYCGAAILVGVVIVSVPETTITQYIFNYSALLLLIYILGFYGLRQQKIFYPEIEIPTRKQKYQNSLLTDRRKTIIKNAVLKYIETEKAYLNPDLNMSVLSEKLQIPKHNITEVLNVELGKNFFRLINEYRIEEVKKQLSDPKNNYSIEAIGYECGFNSKSAFFTVFKNLTGMTPNMYKERYGN
ncbi:MAG TPA: helix-turn-helix domain-containing protein [Bacteroidales bacterium]|nr:helix-turn-helix domain-containing protein [Bacteroidales bacterium]